MPEDQSPEVDEEAAEMRASMVDTLTKAISRLGWDSRFLEPAVDMANKMANKMANAIEQVQELQG